MLWRRIINGYPYKSIEELGVANKEEAFTATQHAIFCYRHGNNPDSYEAIGEAGERTLKAMRMIINNANQLNERKISSTLTINKVENEWKQDEIDKQYVSKIYDVTAGATIKDYKISIIKEKVQDIGGIKITDMQNNEKSQFAANEKFKVLIPIREMTELGSFQLVVEGQVRTKPVLYGVAPTGYTDYSLATMAYEDGTGEKNDQYPENETKIIILKEDAETKERLENTEFELLDEKKEVVYANLKTDKEGRIEINHLIPGKYYLKETKPKEGYEAYKELIELQVSLHEQYTVTVNNNQEEKPKIEVEKSEKNKEVSSSTVQEEKPKTETETNEESKEVSSSTTQEEPKTEVETNEKMEEISESTNQEENTETENEKNEENGENKEENLSINREGPKTKMIESKKSVEVESSTMKRLPVTGM